MTEEILKKQEEEIKDTDATLPSSETEAEKLEAAPEVPELNSTAVPTEKQIDDAGLESAEAESAVENDEVPSETNVEAEEISENVEKVEDPMTEEQEAVEKMLTQSQVDEIVGRTRTETRDKTRTETMQGVYNRYGVKDDGGLDDMAGRSQKYDLLREDYDNLAKELSDIKVKLAMYDSDIAPERYEDARLILTGKGLDVTADNIKAEMETHPEWKKSLPLPGSQVDEVKETFRKTEEPVSTISALGNETIPAEQSGQTERDAAMKWFK